MGQRRARRSLRVEKDEGGGGRRVRTGIRRRESRLASAGRRCARERRWRGGALVCVRAAKAPSRRGGGGVGG